MGRLIYLTENQFKDYIKFTIEKYGKIKNDVFRKTLPDGYGKYFAEDIGIPYDLYLPEFPKKKMVCYSPYEKDKTKLKEYEIRYNNTIAKTEQDEYIRLFININLPAIYNLSEGKIGTLEFYNEVVGVLNLNDDGEYDKNMDILSEMSTLSKNVTGLKTNLWVDEVGTYKKGKHWQRLKFDPQNGTDKTSRQFPSITIEDEPKIIKKYDNQIINLKSNDIEDIKQFIINNKENLLLMGDGKVKKDSEFIPDMVRKEKNTIKRPIKNWEKYGYKVAFTDEYGYDQLVLVDENGKYRYNFTKHNGTGLPYCDYWFDKLTGFFESGSKINAWGEINNVKYQVYTDGNVVPVRR